MGVTPPNGSPLPSVPGPADAVAYDRQKTVLLPCGRVVQLAPLDGECQRRLSPGVDGRLDDPNGAVSDVLARVVKTVDGRRINPDHLRDQVRRWPGASRMLAFAWARALAYGSTCVLEWKCPGAGGASGTGGGDCGASQTTDVDIVDLPVSPLDAGFLRDGLTLTHIRSEVRVRVVCDTGATNDAFSAALARKEAGPLDAGLAQVVEINGRAVSAKAPLRDVLALPADALVDIRAAINALEPRVFYDEKRRAAWITRTNTRLANAFAECSELLKARTEAVEMDATGATVGDGEAGEGAGAPVSVLALPFAVGGYAMRVQVCCEKCGAVSWQGVAAAPDFFFHHIRQAVAED